MESHDLPRSAVTNKLHLINETCYRLLNSNVGWIIAVRRWFANWQPQIPSLLPNRIRLIVWMVAGKFVCSMEAPSKAFLLFFLLPDKPRLKLNHLKSRMECGFSDIFSRHICYTVAGTIGVTNYAVSSGAKECSENHI